MRQQDRKPAHRQPSKAEPVRLAEIPTLRAPEIADLLDEIDAALGESDAQKNEDCGCWQQRGRP